MPARTPTPSSAVRPTAVPIAAFPGSVAVRLRLSRAPGYYRPMVLPGDRIETPRLILRAFTGDDLDDLYAYQSRQDVARYLHWNARDRAEARQALDRQCQETALDAEGDWLTYAVVWPEIGKVIGEV